MSDKELIELLREAVLYALTHEDCTETRDVLRKALSAAGERNE